MENSSGGRKISQNSEQLQRGILKQTGQAFGNLWYLLLQMLSLAATITSEKKMSLLIIHKRGFALALGTDFHKGKCLRCIL